MHDKHYRDMDIQPIEVIRKCILPNTQLGREKAYLIAQGLKYVMRCGRKKEGTVDKDLEKAMSYLHRAIYGTWWKGRDENPAPPTDTIDVDNEPWNKEDKP